MPPRLQTVCAPRESLVVWLHSGGEGGETAVSMSSLHAKSVVRLSWAWSSMGLVVTLIAALLIGSQSPVGAVAGYGDVPEASWYTDAVQWSVDNEITDISGVCFGIDTPVSRGETAVWIHNMENQPDTGEPHSFTDVTDASQDDAISWMANTGITTGTSPSTFAPDDTLRRAQVAAFLHRLAGEPSAPPHSFVDVVAGWQQDPVSWMSHTGITTGTTPTTFAPRRHADQSPTHHLPIPLSRRTRRNCQHQQPDMCPHHRHDNELQNCLRRRGT